MPNEYWAHVQELLEKECRFEGMAMKTQNNSKKITEIEAVIVALRSERNAIV